LYKFIAPIEEKLASKSKLREQMKHADKNVFSFIHAASSLLKSKYPIKLEIRKNFEYPLSSVVLFHNNPGSTLPSIVYPLDVPMSDFVPSHPGRKKVLPWATT
jgi:hypothetical protein